MKTNFLFLVILLLGGIILSSCDEDTGDLLADLAQGKMVVVINDGEPVLMEDCKWMNYGENMKGEVFVEAHLNGQSTEPFVSIIYGSYSNDVALTTRSYSTAFEADKMIVFSTYGNSDEGATVIVEFVEITATTVKGRFRGKLKQENGTIINVKGAFWCSKFVQGAM
jgi:hypothetical protein